MRSAIAYTTAAGSITGFQYQGLAELLWRFAEAELGDLELPHGGDGIVARLIELEREAVEALQDTIPATGHTGDSEALEHHLEHMIMRKQEQVDALLRASRG